MESEEIGLMVEQLRNSSNRLQVSINEYETRAPLLATARNGEIC